MADEKQITVTLSPKAAEFVRRKVARGDFADESEAVGEGLALLEDHDAGLERWLREEAIPACAEIEADPSKSMSSSEVFAELEQARRLREKKPA